MRSIYLRPLIIACLFFIISPAKAQTEEQRKYIIDNREGIEDFILSSGSTQNLSTHYHSTYTYYDIYLDTPDQLLLKNNLSLRFRKRVTNKKKRPITYGMQLKSEMDSLNSVRMEVEETELDFYLVKADSGWVSMTVLLDTIFAHFDRQPDQPISENAAHAIALIESWIQFKAGGAIAPFQKLTHLGFELAEIKTLKPINCGKIKRHRSHIYTTETQNQALNLSQNRVKRNNVPKFFKDKTDYNWLLESSLDLATFYSLSPTQKSVAIISEYEVENKHSLPEVGQQALRAYEQTLKKRFGATSGMDSKYRQAMGLFLGARD